MMKSINNIIKELVYNLQDGELIQLSEMNIPEGKQIAAAKALSRLALKGEIKRIKRGLYYKPGRSKFGKMQPEEKKIIDKLLKKSNGYLTGTAAYNNMGITTQVPKNIVIASKYNRTVRTIGNIKIRYRRTSAVNIDANSRVLQILDALKDIKRIPDTSVDQVVERVIENIKDLKPKDREEMIKCTFDYKPSVRTLVCAIFDQEFKKLNVEKLSKTLSPFTVYDIGITENVLRNKGKFRIK